MSLGRSCRGQSKFSILYAGYCLCEWACVYMFMCVCAYICVCVLVPEGNCRDIAVFFNLKQFLSREMHPALNNKYSTSIMTVNTLCHGLAGFQGYSECTFTPSAPARGNS